MTERSVDTSKPNAGRVYDYILGGNHNFPADRLFADRLTEIFPQAEKWVRLNRWFLYHVTDHFVEESFTNYLDLATGLPTQGYIHERVPETTRIVYNDIDPATVAYAEMCFGKHQNIKYIQGDLRVLPPILEQAEQFLRPPYRTGIFMVGIAYFIDDEPLAAVLRQLYEWAEPGSQLAITFGVGEQPNPQLEAMLALYRSIGQPLQSRTRRQIAELMQRWEPLGEGLEPLYQAVKLPPGTTVERSGDEMMMGAIYQKR